MYLTLTIEQICMLHDEIVIVEDDRMPEEELFNVAIDVVTRKMDLNALSDWILQRI
ncbi:hypothetical protein D3C73_1198750 [compost metagenome]